MAEPGAVTRALYRRLLTAARGLSERELRFSIEKKIRNRFRAHAFQLDATPLEVLQREQVAANTARFLTSAGRVSGFSRLLLKNTVQVKKVLRAAVISCLPRLIVFPSTSEPECEAGWFAIHRIHREGHPAISKPGLPLLRLNLAQDSSALPSGTRPVRVLLSALE